MILVIYAILTEQNIAKLFLAAFIPGVMAAAGYSAGDCLFMSGYIRNQPGCARPRAMAYVCVRCWMSGLYYCCFYWLLGSIYLGWFTPTEAAAIGAFGTGLMAYLSGGLKLEISGREFLCDRSIYSHDFLHHFWGQPFIMVFLALTQVPREIGLWVSTQGFSPIVVVIFIICFYLVLGLFYGQPVDDFIDYSDFLASGYGTGYHLCHDGRIARPPRRPMRWQRAYSLPPI